MCAVRNIPHKVPHEHVPCVEVAGSIHNAVVVRVDDVSAVRRSVVEALGPSVCHAEEETVRHTPLQVCLHGVVEGPTIVLSFDNGGGASVCTKCVRIDTGVLLEGSMMELVSFCQM